MKYATFYLIRACSWSFSLLLCRGVPDPVQIVGPKIVNKKHRQTKEEERNQLKVILNIYNRLPLSLEVFSHSDATVHSIELKENEDCFRFLSHASFVLDMWILTCILFVYSRMAGTLKPQVSEEVVESNVLPVFLSTPKIATVNMSSRQVTTRDTSNCVWTYMF
jgi:hypothetical protein